MNTAAANPVSVTVNNTFWDVYVASLTMIRYQGALMVVHAVFPLAGLFLIFGSVRAGFRFATDEVLVILLAFSFTPLVTVLAVWANRRRNKLAKGPFTFSFDAEGIHVTNDALDQIIKWPGILRVRESKRFLFIFLSPSRAYCIPRKALMEQGVLDEVLSIACEHADFR
jgi:YcxB-like protein